MALAFSPVTLDTLPSGLLLEIVNFTVSYDAFVPDLLCLAQVNKAVFMRVCYSVLSKSPETLAWFVRKTRLELHKRMIEECGEHPAIELLSKSPNISTHWYYNMRWLLYNSSIPDLHYKEASEFYKSMFEDPFPPPHPSPRSSKKPSLSEIYDNFISDHHFNQEYILMRLCMKIPQLHAALTTSWFKHPPLMKRVMFEILYPTCSMCGSKESGGYSLDNNHYRFCIPCNEPVRDNAHIHLSLTENEAPICESCLDKYTESDSAWITHWHCPYGDTTPCSSYSHAGQGCPCFCHNEEDREWIDYNIRNEMYFLEVTP